MKFGKYAAIDAAKHELAEEPEWYWMYRPITSGDEMVLLKWLQEKERDWLEIAWRELAISFAGTNIPDAEGEPIINPASVITGKDYENPQLIEDKIRDVEAVLRQMPMKLVGELWKALSEANPMWGPRLVEPAPTEAEASPTSSES